MENPYQQEAAAYMEAHHNVYVRDEGRFALCRKYAWAIPNDEALGVIAKYGPIVEGGAGSGYWAHLLRERGVDVVAYDDAPYENNWVDGRWTEVLVGSAAAMAQHGDRTLLLVWPPYNKSMALDHLLAHNGQTVIYVGEGLGGCTADHAFHHYLEDHFEKVEEVNIPMWPGMHDGMEVWRRKS